MVNYKSSFNLADSIVKVKASSNSRWQSSAADIESKVIKSNNLHSASNPLAIIW